jgi:hypothetical protein
MIEQSKNVGVNPRWRKAFYGLLALFIALVLLAVYGIVDQAVTITYMQEGMKTVKADLSVLARLAPSLTKGISRKEIVPLLRQQNPEELIAEESGTIVIGQLIFKFDKDGRLDSVKER